MSVLSLKSKLALSEVIDPESLSSFERRNLKHAFRSVDNAHKFVKYRYNSSMRPGS